MPSIKQLLQKEWLYKLAVFVLASYIRLVFLTSRKQLVMHPDARRYMDGDEAAIFAFWHGRMMLMPPLCPKNRPANVVISLHRDGVLISDVIKAFHFKTIHGSSSKQGREALMATLRALREGENIAITPDGPRGPKRVAAGGASIAAKLSGRPVIPVTFSSSFYKRMNSWDEMVLALPFGRAYFYIGAPIFIERDMDDEEARLAVETTLNHLTDAADAELL